MNAIRVLVVDDAAVVRRQVSLLLGAAPGLEVVATAPNGRIALAKVEQFQPDVVLLDLEMPELDGLETLKLLRQRAPELPVVMFSALTERAGVLTLEALALGARDYVTKPTSAGGMNITVEAVRDELVRKLKALNVRTPSATPSPPLVTREPQSRPRVPARVEAIVVGASTGGPGALVRLVSALPADLPVPVFIVQHMPPLFTRLLAERLQGVTPLTVREAVTGASVNAGEVWVAPGDFHLAVCRDATGVRLLTHQGPAENACRPAVDLLFRSAAEVYGTGVLAVVLTGMGQDGLRGCRRVNEAGGQVVVQDQASCVVGSMPGAVEQAGLADAVVPLEALSLELARRVDPRGRRT
ncbi:chemotaxis-specific protein-glutamate methyltransferase CheB [Corallococcus exiguus]|uniref:chemotaxis-specific protein-glutamate methyltransferase CheB n=1 Tax=Corallococcus TaxID=83461 RepID=UPI000ED5FC9B|nr:MULTISPECIES: chemotaxis-specific protein-glutamate methyltransferase CheB [Corallococcus]NRD64897.1 chemotaxis-specific protein-glutamate methyltransferase CheB [Corallococcus exiguus]RKI06558.1 chemotaxis-specific protein-glutamate methyltransferase CheB [Corallococcus sp. AB030]RUO91176.1 chemotaxis-specific protein-glutamate methyltransferase CheB [Corallococcus sp. AB018]